METFGLINQSTLPGAFPVKSKVQTEWEQHAKDLAGLGLSADEIASAKLNFFAPEVAQDREREQKLKDAQAEFDRQHKQELVDWKAKEAISNKARLDFLQQEKDREDADKLAKSQEIVKKSLSLLKPAQLQGGQANGMPGATQITSGDASDKNAMFFPPMYATPVTADKSVLQDIYSNIIGASPEDLNRINGVVATQDIDKWREDRHNEEIKAQEEQDKAVTKVTEALQKAQEERNKRLEKSGVDIAKNREDELHARVEADQLEKNAPNRGMYRSHDSITGADTGEDTKAYESARLKWENDKAHAKAAHEKAVSELEENQLRADTVDVANSIKNPEAQQAFDNLWASVPSSKSGDNIRKLKEKELQAFMSKYGQFLAPEAQDQIKLYVQKILRRGQ